MNRLISVALLGLVLSAPAFAADPTDSLIKPGTLRVAQSAGDTINTYTTVCNVTGAATIRAAVTNRSRRRICVKNRSGFLVYIGSATLAASNLYELTAATGTASEFCTNTSAAILCNTQASSASSGTVVAIEEVQSNP